jgi:Ni,Fe-hydrogenase III component G
MSEEKLGQHYLAALNEAFPGVVLDHAWQTKDQLTVTVKVNYLPEVVEFLYYKQGGWLSVLFGNDERKLNGHYAVYYALSMEGAEKCWIVVKALVDADSREFPSVTPRVPAAVWGEREIRDMYGLIPVGLPDQRRLVLPDDWPEDMHPLRKDAMDYRLRPEPTTDSETYAFINEGNSDARVIPVGPLHITSDEPGHFRLFVDGEQICTPTETCFIANYSGRHRIEVYAVRYIPRTGQSVKGDLLFQEWVSNPGMNIRNIRVGYNDRPDFCPDRPVRPGYDVVMNRTEFDRFLRTVKDKHFDSDRNKLIETTLVSTGFTSDQCLQLVNLFSFDSEKIKLMQAMYHGLLINPISIWSSKA